MSCSPGLLPDSSPRTTLVPTWPTCLGTKQTLLAKRTLRASLAAPLAGASGGCLRGAGLVLSLPPNPGPGPTTWLLPELLSFAQGVRVTPGGALPVFLPAASLS